MSPTSIFVGEVGGEAGISSVEMAKALLPLDRILAGDAGAMTPWLSDFLGVETVLTPRADSGRTDEYLSIVRPVLQDGGVLAPSTEFDVRIVQQHLPQWYLPSVEVIDLMSDKLPPTEDFFSVCGITQIPTYRAHPAPGSDHLAKPRYGAGSKGHAVVTGPVDSPTDYVYQPVVAVDHEVVVDILFDQVLLVYLPRRVFCIKAGSDIAVRLLGTDDPDFPRFYDHIDSVCRNIRYRGIANFQYLVDEHDRAWFLEANPRLSGFSRVWLSERINLMEAFFQWIEGADVRRYQRKTSRCYYRGYQHQRVSLDTQ